MFILPAAGTGPTFIGPPPPGGSPAASACHAAALSGRPRPPLPSPRQSDDVNGAAGTRRTATVLGRSMPRPSRRSEDAAGAAGARRPAAVLGRTTSTPPRRSDNVDGTDIAINTGLNPPEGRLSPAPTTRPTGWYPGATRPAANLGRQAAVLPPKTTATPPATDRTSFPVAPPPPKGSVTKSFSAPDPSYLV